MTDRRGRGAAPPAERATVHLPRETELRHWMRLVGDVRRSVATHPLTPPQYIFIIEDMSRAPRSDDPADHLPLRPAAFSAMAALADGPRAGFAILSVINESVPGHPILGPGTLYRLLRELRLARLIEPVAAPPEEDLSDDRRQYHGLTPLGRAVLCAEAERLRRTLAAAGLLHPGRGAG